MAAPKNPFNVSAARRPRARIVVGGQVLGGVKVAEVTNNSFFAADTWSAEIALGKDPDRAVEFWGQQDEIEVEILFAFAEPGKPVPDGGWRSLLVGTTSRIRIDENQGIVHLDGRDFTSKLIEQQVVDTYANLKASDIAKKFAAQHGLTADVDETPGLVGSLYEHDHTGVSTGEFSRATTQWDYLSHLAQQYEGFQVWVRGRTLYFKKVDKPDKADAFILRWKRAKVTASALAAVTGAPVFDAKTLDVERDITRAKDIEVVVRSWRGSQAAGFEVIARRSVDTLHREHRERHGRGRAAADPNDPLSGLDAADAGPDPLDGIIPGRRRRTAAAQSHNERAPRRQNGIHRYIYEVPGMTHDAALQYAQAKLREATLHERKITVTMPGELDLDARRLVTLVGHGSTWDQDYYVSEITRRLSVQGGFEQSLTAKNENPGGVTKVTTTGTT